MLSDPIADFLTRLRNASLAGKTEVPVKPSRAVAKIAAILKSEGFIAELKNGDDALSVTLTANSPISHIKRLSRPGVRYYVKSVDIPRPRGGTGLVIVSTPKGMLTGHQARKQKVGGELVCEVW